MNVYILCATTYVNDLCVCSVSLVGRISVIRTYMCNVCMCNPRFMLRSFIQVFLALFFFGFLTILSSLCSVKLLISLLLAGVVLCTWMAGWKPFILSHEAICCIDPPLLYVDALGANPILVHVYIPALIYSLLMWCLRGGGTYIPPSRCKLYICRQAEVLCTYVRTYIVGTRCIS